jgi:hypothetical protein
MPNWTSTKDVETFAKEMEDAGVKVERNLTTKTFLLRDIGTKLPRRRRRYTDDLTDEFVRWPIKRNMKLSKRATLGLDLIPGNQGQQGGQGEYGQGNQSKNRYVGVGVKEPTDFPGQGQWDKRVPIRQQVPDEPLEYEVLPKLKGAIMISKREAQVNKNRFSKYEDHDADAIRGVLEFIREKNAVGQRNKNLSDEELWEKLISSYGGSELMALLDAINNRIAT